MESAQRELRRVFGQFATGVTVVTGRMDDGTPVGVTANSVTSVSLDPPLLLWCLANTSRNLGAFPVGRRFAIHVLAEDQAEVALHFARSAETKFGERFRDNGDGAPPVIAGVLARIVCDVATQSVAGDHTLIVGQVADFAARSGAPLVFHASRFGTFTATPADGDGEPWRLFVDMWS